MQQQTTCSKKNKQTKKNKMRTYGNFILMNNLHIKNGTTTHKNPKNNNKIRFNLGKPGPFALSMIT